MDTFQEQALIEKTGKSRLTCNFPRSSRFPRHLTYTRSSMDNRIKSSGSSMMNFKDWLIEKLPVICKKKSNQIGFFSCFCMVGFQTCERENDQKAES
jgi:hypothetical protein